MAEFDYGTYIRTLPGKNRCDLSPLLASPDVLARALEDLAAPFSGRGITKVAALDALGFALGGGVAQLLGAGLVLVRKGEKSRGTLGSTTFTDYSREEKCFEIAENAVTQDDSVLIVDDWSETGAQLRAAIALLESMGSKVIGAALINIEDDLLHNPVLSRYTLHSLLGGRLVSPYDPAPPELLGCTRCPRLVHYRERVAQEKRRAYREETYWGSPYRVLVILRPGFCCSASPPVHTARTGRAGCLPATAREFSLPGTLPCGFSKSAGRHLTRRRHGAQRYLYYGGSPLCAPDNKPTRDEFRNCQSWLERDFGGLPNIRVVIALGSIAHASYLELLQRRGHDLKKAAYPFKHGALHTFAGAAPLLDSYHVSLQNTNTGRLTEKMFGEVLEGAKEHVAHPETPT